MKCKICGARANSLPAMAEHYRKKHPSKMKRHSKPKTLHRGLQTLAKMKTNYCPTCGQPL